MAAVTDGSGFGPPVRRVPGPFLLVVVVAVVAAVAGYVTLDRWWSTASATRWAAPVAGVLGYELWLVWRGLAAERARGERAPSAGLSVGNALTVARGLLVALLAGFLLVPQPAGALGRLPGALYAVSVVLDVLDGWLARRAGGATALGETLDVEFDALGLLVAPLLAVRYGQLPLAYLAVGVARYAFVGGLRLRRWRGLSVHPLPPSRARRVLAALQMVVVSSALLYVVRPPLSTVVAAVAMAPFFAGFLRDWLAVTGRIGRGG